MQIAQLLQSVKKETEQKENRLAAEVLLAFVLQKGREYFITHEKEEVLPEMYERFGELWQRFLKGEPVAYLNKKKEFFGLDFFVDQRVLIPRPETEQLMEKIIEFASGLHAPRILDIGTGSGCIAVSVAKHLPNAKITASDISTGALEVAKMNAQKHQVDVRFVQSDLLSNIEGSFDIMVANLPYIGEKRFNFLSKQAHDYEPHLALFGGEDGLQLYAKLFEQLKQQNWQPQYLLGEFGFLQSEEVEKILQQSFPGQRFEIFKDYANIERIFVLHSENR